MAGCILLLLTFRAGMIVGYHKAMFSYRWGENYHRNFGGPRFGFFSNSGRDFIESHGTFGQVIKIDSTTLVVKGRDDVEKIIVITKDTAIRRGIDNIMPIDLRVDDPVVIIGTPNNDGQIEARLIRVMPAWAVNK